MDPYTGEVYAEASYPSYDANDYAAIAATTRRGSSTRSSAPSTSPARCSRCSPPLAGARERHGQADDAGQRHGLAVARPRPGPDLRRRPAGDGLDARSRTSSPTRGTSAPPRSPWAWPRPRRPPSASSSRPGSGSGFGQPTGIDLAGEVAGHRPRPDDQPWRQIDLANGAFGQGVAVTPIQLATAYSAMVNGGHPVTPHVVAAVGNHAGRRRRPGPGHLADAVARRSSR